MALVVAVALVATACSDRSRDLGEATGRTQSSGPSWDPESVPALASAPASGEPLPSPAAPVSTGAVLDGTLGTSTSTEPILRWVTDAPGPYRFTVEDLRADARELWSSGDQLERSVRVPAGVLAPDRAYRWSASNGRGESTGPHVFRVDLRRDGVQPLEEVDGVAVARGSGEAVLVWSSPTVETLAGPAGFALEHRPSNPARPGLPAGWRLRTSGGPWDRLSDNGDGTLTLEGSSGLSVVYEPVDDGASWRAVWGRGQDWPSGRFATLVRNPDGTFTTQDTSGTVTTFTDPTGPGAGSISSVWRAGQASIRQEWRDGRLVGLVDSVTAEALPDRRIELRYGGDADCPAPTGGLVAAPEGMLCGAELWDGTVVAVAYADTAAGPQPARLVAAAGSGAPAQVTDLAFDDLGRLAAVRSPLATAAVAAGSRTAGEDVTTSVAYDDANRVASVTGPAPVGGAVRSTTAFTYEVDDGVSLVSRTAVGGVTTSELQLDPSTFQTRRGVDRAGRVTEVTWDASRSAVAEVRQPGDLVTRTSYDDLGNPVSRVGPATPDAIANGAAPAARVTLDRSYFGPEDREGTPRKGLAVTYWTTPDHRGDPAREEIGPAFDGQVLDEYSFSWAEPPVGDGEWSARLTGVLRVPEAGAYSIRADGGPELFVDEQPCRPACAVDADPARPLRIRLDVTGEGAAVTLSWDGPGVSGTVPTSFLAPAVGLQAGLTVRDSFSNGETADALGRTVWADPVAGIVGETWSDSGITRTARTEAYRPSDGDYARVTGYAQPSGALRRLEYHPATEEVADPCGRGAAVQGGMLRAGVDPGPDGGDGVRQEQVLDAGGRVAAVRSGSAGWTCTTYDAAGRVVRTETRDRDGRPVTTTTVDHTGRSSAAATDPLVRTTTVVDPAGTHRSSVTVDLLGREVSATDLSGTTTTTAYDPVVADRVLSSTSTPRGGAASTTTYTWAPDGQLAAATVDGRPFFSFGRDDIGRVTSVSYGNGAVATYGYDANGRPVTRTVRLPGGAAYDEELVLSPAGRTLAATLASPSGRARYDYNYDVDARLVAATLDTTVPVTARAWQYDYDANTNRTAERVTDAAGAVREFRATFDGADRLTLTTDPRFAGKVTHDADGRVTAVGPLRISYDALGNVSLVEHADGSSVAWGYVGSEAVSRTVTDASGSSRTVSFDGAGFVRVGDGPPVARILGAPGGVQVVARIAGPAEWTFATIGGNRWFSTDGTGAADGSMSLFDPYGSLVTTPPAASGAAAPPTTAPPTTAPSTTTPSTSSTTTSPSTTTVPSTTISSSTMAPTSSTTAPDGETGATGGIASAGPTTTSTTASPTAPTTAPTTAPAGVAAVADAPLVDARFQLGDTQVLGDVALQTFGSRLYLPALGRFLQPDPVPGASANAYGYTDGDPVNAHDVSGNMPDWAKWTLFGVILVASIALSAVAAPAAGAAIGAKIAGGAAVTGKAAVAQVATSALVGAAVGAGSDIAIQATFTEGFEEGDLDVGQMAISAGIAGVISGYQAYGAVKSAQKTVTAITASKAKGAQGSQASLQVDKPSQINFARSIRSGSQSSQGSLEGSMIGSPERFETRFVISRSPSLGAQKNALFGREFEARNIEFLN